jgi:hypothetical protein
MEGTEIDSQVSWEASGSRARGEVHEKKTIEVESPKMGEGGRGKPETKIKYGAKWKERDGECAAERGEGNVQEENENGENGKKTHENSSQRPKRIKRANESEKEGIRHEIRGSNLARARWKNANGDVV